MISDPLSYLGRSVKLYFQLSFFETFFEATSLPFARSLTVISGALFPSWLSASFHVFVPLISIVSGV